MSPSAQTTDPAARPPGSDSKEPAAGPDGPSADTHALAAGSSGYERMVRRLSSRAALWVGAAWGLAEASLFFIVPDVWLGFVALYAPRRAPITLLAIIVGAVTGAALLFVATLIAGNDLSGIVTGLPGITPEDLARARSELADQGGVAFLNGPLQGLPVKLYVHGSALHGIDLLTVAVMVVLNRLERMILFGIALAVVGVVGRPVIRRWPRACAVAYVVVWVIFYAGYVLAPGT